MRRGPCLAALAAALASAGQARAACDPAALAGPSLTQCLTAEEKASSAKVQAAYQAAVASIATRPGVFDAQRARWRNSLAESHDIWLRLRNAECQNVAPFEGQAASTSVVRNRMAAFEAKLACAVRMNETRAADLSARYPPAGPRP
jgi:uncharacterized protein YecT (DUF1311 family)